MDADWLSIDRRGFARLGLALGAALIGDHVLAQAGGASKTDVQTQSGQIAGTFSDGSFAFKGVPYGGDTAGRRFQPADPPQPWRGVRPAFGPGPRCPQIAGRSDPPLLSSWAIAQDDGEDCLRLNIWTPALGDGAKRPVMVWLHGGGFSSGTGSSRGYDGARLAARHGVVLVAVTHRINAFGHLYLRELGGEAFADSGNVGMLDVVQALTWVRDNIVQFGGDPGNVTVFGQSGGAGKVTVLMAMPAAKGLFHRAIVESGSTGVGARSASSATEDAIAFMDGLGLAPGQVQALSALPMERLREGLVTLTRRKVGEAYPWGASTRREWRPVVDGRALPEHPFYPAGPAISADIPLMVGTTKDECRFHLGSADPKTFAIGWEELAPRLRLAMGQDPTAAIAFYRGLYPQATASELLFKIFTFWRWRYSAIWQAERKVEQKAAPVFVYRFDWETPVDGGRWKAPHTVELPFAFDNVALSRSLLGEAPGAQALADQTSAAWVRFARTGDPNGPGLPAWPAYDLSRRATLCFDAASGVRSDLEAQERAFFSSSPPRLPL